MLTHVSVLVTTFLRDGYLLECLKRINAYLPDCPIIVVDDGYSTPEKLKIQQAFKGTQHDTSFHWCDYEFLPFDSGLPAKRNLGAKLCKTRYLLMGCDDFDFSPIEARMGIQKLAGILDLNPEIDVAGGRHNNNPYEGFLELVPGSHIQETRLVPDGKHEFYPVDLTVNYFMARTEMVRQFPWDERMKIGGEHGDWFLDLKQAGRNVVWVPGVNITEFSVPKGSDPSYSRYRGRAKDLGHKIFLEKRGITDYRGF